MTKLALLSIIFSLLFLIWMRYSLFKKALKLDQETYTPSDFCIMGMTMKFNDYSSGAITEKIKEVFKEKWDIEVEYVNIAYNIVDFYKLSEKFNSLTKLRAIAKNYCVKEKINKNQYQELSKSKKIPNDFPRKPSNMPFKKVIYLD